MKSVRTSNPEKNKHKRWVKTSHWVVTLAFLVLFFSGIEILMVHPRLYWGEVGNELTPALLELPISRNHDREEWEEEVPFYSSKNSPVSAGRKFDELMFNQNGWGRSLHFLAAWILVLTGVIYLLLGVFSAHFRYNIWPKFKELTFYHFLSDLKDHFQMKIAPASGGPSYGLLQKLAYSTVIFIAFPLAVVTGFTMSPAITAAYPVLLELFGGFQSARTIHFFTSLALELFLLMHLVMILISGFKNQIKYMTLGK
jgi:thiosulfate reductase cytochrome b subunit